MRRIATALTLGVCLTQASCAPPEEFTEAERAAVADSIAQTIGTLLRAMEAEGWLAQLKYVDNSPEMFCVSYFADSLTFLSYDQYAAQVRAEAPSIRAVQFDYEDLQVRPLTRDYAFYSGKVREVLTDTAGVTHEVVAVESGVLIRRDDGWKYQKWHFSGKPK